MSAVRLIALTSLALLAFAGNSLLCRAALANSSIDPASFTAVRLLSGALVLSLLVWLRQRQARGTGNWLSALALFAYAAGFSFAYVHLTAAVGALLLFGAVQTTMTGYGLWLGERMSLRQIVGLLLACGGLVGLLLPGLSAPPLVSSLLMLGAGMAWGVYSLRGKSAAAPLKVTAGNFVRTVPMAVALSVWQLDGAALSGAGIVYAVLSGALASGVGYAIWYTALPALKSTTAATLQLAVPIVAAFGGVALLGEHFTVRLMVASVAVIGGIALVVLTGKPEHAPENGPAPSPRGTGTS